MNGPLTGFPQDGLLGRAVHRNNPGLVACAHPGLTGCQGGSRPARMVLPSDSHLPLSRGWFRARCSPGPRPPLPQRLASGAAPALRPPPLSGTAFPARRPPVALHHHGGLRPGSPRRTPLADALSALSARYPAPPTAFRHGRPPGAAPPRRRPRAAPEGTPPQEAPVGRLHGRDVTISSHSAAPIGSTGRVSSTTSSVRATVSSCVASCCSAASTSSAITEASP